MVLCCVALWWCWCVKPTNKVFAFRRFSLQGSTSASASSRDFSSASGDPGYVGSRTTKGQPRQQPRPPQYGSMSVDRRSSMLSLCSAYASPTNVTIEGFCSVPGTTIEQNLLLGFLPSDGTRRLSCPSCRKWHQPRRLREAGAVVKITYSEEDQLQTSPEQYWAHERTRRELDKALSSYIQQPRARTCK